MSRRLRLLPLLAAVALAGTTWATPHEAAGASTAPLRVVAQRGGLRLELSVPHGSYPRDALVRVRAIVRNTSHHTIWIEGGGPPAPGKYLPQVEVLDVAGRSLPLSLTTYFPSPGPAPVQLPLAPGASVGAADDVVLRGSWVRVEVTLLRMSSSSVHLGPTLHTHALHVQLLPPDPPAVQINTGVDGPAATVSPPAGVHGLPQAVWYADCGGTNFNQWLSWTSVSLHFAPGCSPLRAWHLLVGWRGHSVAAIDWSKSGTISSIFRPGTSVENCQRLTLPLRSRRGAGQHPP